MAVIIQRRKIFSVVYQVEENDNIVSKLEAFFSMDQALKRKNEIESKGKEIPITFSLDMKIKDYLAIYMQLCGTNLLSLNSYDRYNECIKNYIEPIIKNDKLKKVNTDYAHLFFEKVKQSRVFDKRIQEREPDKLISAGTVELCYRVLKGAFEIAQQCKLYNLNPFDIEVDYGYVEKNHSDEWTEEYITKIIDECTKSKLFIILNLMFGCHLCAKEALGLMWDNVFIDDELYAKNQCYLVLDKELVRVSKRSVHASNSQGIIKLFDSKKPNSVSNLALMHRYSGNKNVPIPLPVVKILRQWKNVQDEHIQRYGKKYVNNSLVIALRDGRPCEYRVIEKEFDAIREELELPKIKLGQLKNFSLNKDVMKDVYERLVNELGLIQREVAYKEVKKYNKTVYKIDSKLLKDIDTGKDESFDIFEIANILSKDPALAKELAKLLQ